MALPVGSRFRPKDLGLVRRYLSNMVHSKDSSFITTMEVYKDEPWLLPHVSNPLFEKREWYYFVPMTKRAGNIKKRTVPGRGGSEGGFWKSTGRKIAIKDRQETLMGFKQCLTYYQKRGDDKVKTPWLMKEYTLDKGQEFQELVLCCIHQKKETNDQNLGFVIPQPQPQPQVAETRETNNIVPDQLVQEEDDFADELEAMMLHGEDGDANQQKQQEQEEEEEETQIIPPQELHELEVKMLQGKDGDATQQKQLEQEEEEIRILPLLPNNFGEDDMYFDMDELLGEEEEDQGKNVTEHEEQLPDMDQDDMLLEEMMQQQQEEGEMMMMSNQEQHEWDLDLPDWDLDELLGEEEPIMDQDNMFIDSTMFDER